MKPKTVSVLPSTTPTPTLLRLVFMEATYSHSLVL